MNNFIKAWPAQKHPVTTWEKNSSATQKGLSQVEGILTSPIKLKGAGSQEPYFWAFFQLEGLNQDIPVIFKIPDCPECGKGQGQVKVGREIRACKLCYLTQGKSYGKPEIPPRAKVLLKGTWSESLTSPRPSFTCQEYQILANPPPLTLKDLKEQVSQLLSISLEKKKEWQGRTDFLFRKQKDLQEIEKLTKLGSEYLSAYLLLRKAFYANYQDNLLHVTGPLDNQEEYLTKLQGEIEEVAQNIRAYQSKEITPETEKDLSGQSELRQELRNLQAKLRNCGFCHCGTNQKQI